MLFLCNIIVLNELGSMKEFNLYSLTTFLYKISHENTKFNHFLCKMYINISNAGYIAFHLIHIYIKFFFYNGGCEYQISWDLALCHTFTEFIFCFDLLKIHEGVLYRLNIEQKNSHFQFAYDAEQDIVIIKVSPVFSDSYKSLNFLRIFHWKYILNLWNA